MTDVVVSDERLRASERGTVPTGPKLVTCSQQDVDAIFARLREHRGTTCGQRDLTGPERRL